MKTNRVISFLSAAMVLSAAVGVAQLAKLADPFATPSVRNAATIVAKPDALRLEAPMGFTVTLYADNLQAPRTMMYAPNGDLFVAQSRAGSVVILRDNNNDGIPDTRYTYAQ